MHQTMSTSRRMRLLAIAVGFFGMGALLACSTRDQESVGQSPSQDQTIAAGISPSRVLSSESEAGGQIHLLLDTLHICEQDSAFFVGTVVDAVVNESRVFVLDGANLAVHAFGPSGQLQASFGRQGRGPDELMGPRSMHLDGDSLLVLDPANGAELDRVPLHHSSAEQGKQLYLNGKTICIFRDCFVVMGLGSLQFQTHMKELT